MPDQPDQTREPGIRRIEPEHSSPPDAETRSAEPWDLDVRGVHSAILREHTEPRDGFEPIPIWLVMIYLGITLWIGIYLGLYSGGFSPDRYDHMPAQAQPGTASGDRDQPVDPLVLGKRLFSNCITCHQSDGQGVDGVYPPLAGSEWVTRDPETPARILLHGLEGRIQVRGDSYDGEMPAFGGRLTDEHLAAVLTYIRSEWGNDAPAVSPDLVAALRGQHARRSGPWSADELDALRGSPVPGYPPPASEPAEQADSPRADPQPPTSSEAGDPDAQDGDPDR